VLCSGQKLVFHIQGDSGGKVNILGCDIVGHYLIKMFVMNICLILNAYRNTAV
jgi:hypothetical protein